MANWRRSVSEPEPTTPTPTPKVEVEVEEDFGQTLILQPEVDHRLTKAQREFDDHHYGACVRLIGEIPEATRPPEALELRKRAAAAIEEMRQLQDEVKEGLKAGAYEGLRPRMERYLELKPDDSRFKRLLRQLKDQEAKAHVPSPAAPPVPARAPVELPRVEPESRPAAAAAPAPSGARPAFKTYANQLLRYLQVGAFSGCLLGALIGGFWRPEGYFVGGILGGLLAAANEWFGDK